ncbi:aspartate kinase [Aquimarina rhabdastrellae]
MKVYKFGGASVKDAEGVRNVGDILKRVGYKETVVVISAMGKTTNALEVIVDAYLKKSPKLSELIYKLKEFHYQIVFELFETKEHEVFNKIALLFDALETVLKVNKSTIYDYVYDQIVGYGELISTTIVSIYLNEIGITNDWLAAGEVIKTNSVFRDAKVDWEYTQQAINNQVNQQGLTITQGFIGADEHNFMTTLGREGSDYTAGIFAYCLNANEVSIWKDVPGVLNADPRIFKETQLLEQISYEEAIELAFYGASVIHPKTLQPLQRKEIPLYVRSFVNPEAKGTKVTKGQALEPYVPCFIVKKHQVLISLSTLDFSFMLEENISELFSLFHEHQIKVDVIQNSAISFSVCVENKFNTLENLLTALKGRFKINCEKDVTLYTIRHFTQEEVAKIRTGKTILLEQIAGETYQMITK